MGAAANVATIEKLYAALGRADGEDMASCYAQEATFTDPVFVGLADGEPGDMWRMLTSRAQDMSVQLLQRDADDTSGTAHWVARYTFAQTGRPVANDIRSLFRFDDAGLIVDQQDDFDFWRWARQALGRRGLLLGWTPVLQHAVRDRARAGLEAYRDR